MEGGGGLGGNTPKGDAVGSEGGKAVEVAEEQMMAGLEKLAQVREAMRKRLGAMQAQAAQKPISPPAMPLEEGGTLTDMLSLRDEIARQTVAVSRIRNQQHEEGGGGGTPQALADALDVLVGLQQRLISMTLRPAMQQATQDEASSSLGHPVEEPAGPGSVPRFSRVRRGAVSSECAPQVLATATISKVVVPKGDQQRARLKQALQDLVLFSDVHPEDLSAIVDAFTSEHCAAGTTIMKQGEAGDRFYIVMSGVCDVYVEEGGSMQLVATAADGEGFGELALLYNAPRAATVIARTACTLWSLDRQTFSAVLLCATAKRRSQYMGFLGSVPILSNLTPAEKAKIADVMEAKWFEDGETIIEQGEEGDLLFFIEEGGAVATRSLGEGRPARVVKQYGKGSYFGELALLRDEPRAATVTAHGRCKVCAIDKHAFVRLLGQCFDIMRRNMDTYDGYDGDEDPYLDCLDRSAHGGKPLDDGQTVDVPQRIRRGGVSATPPSGGEPKGARQSHPKSVEAAARLRAALRNMILFSHLEESELESVVGAFFEVRVGAGEEVIRQGEDGDNFYIVDEGECEVYVSKGGEANLVSTLRQGNYFGELALMYNCPRAATVRAVRDGLLFGLGQEVFQHILRSSAHDRRAQYDTFLQRVPILRGLTREERGKIADVMVQSSYKDGEYIIRQDEEKCDSFFIVLEGEAIAHKRRPDGGAKRVMSYQRGDYFGEIALMKNSPRAASVTAQGDCKVVSIDRMAFTRLLGSCASLLTRQMEQYDVDCDLSGEGTNTDEAATEERERVVPGRIGGVRSDPNPPRTRRGGVSSASSREFADVTLREHPKSVEAAARLRAALRNMILFSHLEESELESVVGAFFEVRVGAGEEVIRQGEDGDNFYIVDEGECEVYVSKGGEANLVSTLRQGNYFGELALMYNCPRAATVRAVRDGLLFGLGQEVFQHILRSSAHDRRAQYDTFLQRVPILRGLTREERGKIADVMVQSSYKDGDFIITQGDERADTFFILFEGDAVSTKSYAPGTPPVEVLHYSKGDYFGEIALLNNIPRCANVIAKGDCKVVSIDRRSFTRLLGTLPSRTYL